MTLRTAASGPPNRHEGGRRRERSSRPGRPHGLAAAGPAVWTAAALLLTWACGGRPPDGGDPTEEAAAPDGAEVAPAPAWTDSSAGVAIDSVLRRIEGEAGGSRAEARERLGTPEEENRRTMANRHVEGAVDTLVRLAWPGLEVSFHKSGANQREFLSSVEVTGASRLERILPPTLRDREGLRRTLGDPDRVEGDRWIWVCCPGRPGASESLAVRFRGGRATGLRAGYFVD